MRFEIPGRYLEELAGMKLAEGKLYLIRGRIASLPANGQTAWRFNIYRFVTAHLKLRIYLPKKFHDEVVPGEIYKIVIEAMKEREVPKDSAGIFSLVRHGGRWSKRSIRSPEPAGTNTSNDANSPRGWIQPWRARTESSDWIDWKVVAAWMDTEGYLYVREGRRRRYALAVRQSEPAPLKEIQKFLKGQGIKRCSVKWATGSGYTTGGIHELKLVALKELDAVVAKTWPFLIVPVRKYQYLRYWQRRQEAPNIVKFTESKLKTEDPARWVDWKVVAVWIDGEGNLTTRERGSNKSHRDYCLDISQKERAPLELIRSFLECQGIKAKVIKRPHDAYSLQITTVSDIDRVVKETLPFIMTDNKRLQYEEYKARRMRAPKRGPRPKPPLF